jgi:hypothetical protein
MNSLMSGPDMPGMRYVAARYSKLVNPFHICSRLSTPTQRLCHICLFFAPKSVKIIAETHSDTGFPNLIMPTKAIHRDSPSIRGHGQ